MFKAVRNSFKWIHMLSMLLAPLRDPTGGWGRERYTGDWFSWMTQGNDNKWRAQLSFFFLRHRDSRDPLPFIEATCAFERVCTGTWGGGGVAHLLIRSFKCQQNIYCVPGTALHWGAAMATDNNETRKSLPSWRSHSGWEEVSKIYNTLGGEKCLGKVEAGGRSTGSLGQERRATV